MQVIGHVVHFGQQKLCALDARQHVLLQSCKEHNMKHHGNLQICHCIMLLPDVHGRTGSCNTHAPPGDLASSAENSRCRCSCSALTLPQRQPHAVELHNWQLVPWMLELAPADVMLQCSNVYHGTDPEQAHSWTVPWSKLTQKNQ